MFLPNIKMVIMPLILILLALAAGIIFEKKILTRLHRWSIKTKWNGDEIFIKALHGKTIYIFVFSGLYGASLTLPLTPVYLNLLHKILQIMAIFITTMISSQVAVGFVNLYTQRETGFLPSLSIFTNLARVMVFAIGILISLQSLGISITPILTALGVGGLAVALALQDTLSNLFSGLQLIASRQFKPGDYVKLGTGEEGYITDITWRSTTIRVLSNNLVIIPNSTLATAILTNYQQPAHDLSVSINVSVSYDSDLEKVEEVTIDVAKKVLQETPGGVADFEPVIRYNEFEESGIKFAVVLRAQKFVDQFLIKHEFIKQLHRRYKEENIEIPYPIRTIYLKNNHDPK